MEEDIEINEYDINLNLDKVISFLLSYNINIPEGKNNNDNNSDNNNNNKDNSNQIIEKQQYIHKKYIQFIEYLFENAYVNNYKYQLYKSIPPTNKQFVNIKKVIEKFKDQTKEMYIACRYDNYLETNYKNSEDQENFIYNMVVNQLEFGKTEDYSSGFTQERHTPTFDSYFIVYGLIKHNSRLFHKAFIIKLINTIKGFCNGENFKKLAFDLGHIYIFFTILHLYSQLNKLENVNNSSINNNNNNNNNNNSNYNHNTNNNLQLNQNHKEDNFKLIYLILGLNQNSIENHYSFQKILCDFSKEDKAFTFRYKVPDYKIIILESLLKKYIDTLIIIIPPYNSISNGNINKSVDSTFILLEIADVIKPIQNHYKSNLIEPLYDYMFKTETLKSWTKEGNANNEDDQEGAGLSVPNYKKHESTYYLDESDSDDEQEEGEDDEGEDYCELNISSSSGEQIFSDGSSDGSKIRIKKAKTSSKELTIESIKFKFHFLLESMLENNIMDLKLIEKLQRDIQLKKVTKTLSTFGRIFVPLGLKEFINLSIKLCQALKLQFSLFRFLDMFVESCQILDPYNRNSLLQSIYQAEECIESEWDPDIINIEDNELLLDYFETAFTNLYKDKRIGKAQVLELIFSGIDKGIAPIKKIFIERKLHHFLSLLPMDYINKYLIYQFYSKIQNSKIYNTKYQQHNDVNFNNNLIQNINNNNNSTLNNNDSDSSNGNNNSNQVILSSYLHKYILTILLNDRQTKSKDKLLISLVSKRFYQNTVDIMNNSTKVPIKILLNVYNVKNIIGDYSLFRPDQAKFIKVHQITTPGGIYSKCLDFSRLKNLFKSVEILKIKGRGSLGFSPKDIQHLIDMKSLKKIIMRPLFCQIISNWSDFIRLSNEKKLKFRIHAYAGQSDSFKYGILKDLNQNNTWVKKVATDSLNFLKYYHSSYMQNITSFALHTMADHLVERHMKAFKENPQSKERLKSIKYIQFMLDYKTNAVLYFLKLFEGLTTNLETITMEIRTFDSNEEDVFSEIFKTISFNHPSVKRLIIRGFKINDQYITKFPIILNWNLVKLYNFKLSNTLNYIEFERKSINNDKYLYYNSINSNISNNNNNKRNFNKFINNNQINNINNNSNNYNNGYSNNNYKVKNNKDYSNENNYQDYDDEDEESHQVKELDEIDSSIAHDIDFFHTYSPNELQYPFKYGDIEFSIKF